MWKLIAEVICINSKVWDGLFQLCEYTPWLRCWGTRLTIALLADVRILPKPHWTRQQKSHISVPSAGHHLCLKSFHNKIQELILPAILFYLMWLHVPAVIVKLVSEQIHGDYAMQSWFWILAGYLVVVWPWVNGLISESRFPYEEKKKWVNKRATSIVCCGN
jgi:hypothetical protein